MKWMGEKGWDEYGRRELALGLARGFRRDGVKEGDAIEGLGGRGT